MFIEDVRSTALKISIQKTSNDCRLMIFLSCLPSISSAQANLLWLFLYILKNSETPGSTWNKTEAFRLYIACTLFSFLFANWVVFSYEFQDLRVILLLLFIFLILKYHFCFVPEVVFIPFVVAGIYVKSIRVENYFFSSWLHYTIHENIADVAGLSSANGARCSIAARKTKGACLSPAWRKSFYRCWTTSKNIHLRAPHTFAELALPYPSS